MKKMMIALVAMLTFAATGKAMSYEQARNEALSSRTRWLTS